MTRAPKPKGDKGVISSLPWLVLAICAAVWFQLVSSTVTQPYLDEFFHVRQAKAYISNQWQDWDPKITTPPGLYIIGYVWNYLIPVGDELPKLRSVNLLAITVLIPWKALNIRRLLIQRPHGRTEAFMESLTLSKWVAANIGLFPPLFFFSALFYTDLWSIFWVLQTVETSLAPEVSSQGRAVRIVAFGFVSLWFRQTNIFWVALFPAGIEVTRTLKAIESKTFSRQLEGHDWLEIFTISWNERKVYDPPIEDADFQDYVKTAFSLAVGILGGMKPVVQCIIPYGVLLALFTAFVVWNGGVVLGDKSNHVATIHVTQMIYVWPYISFFSFPLLVPTIVSVLPESMLPASIRSHLVHRRLPVSDIISFAIAVLGIIRVNTIVHPFTLADNRHYVFYIFRWLILRNFWIRYLWAPGYVICGWVVIQSLGRSEASNRVEITKNSPRTRKMTADENELLTGGNDTNRVSFVLIWFTSTFLSLSTAPLVEPRYFILPWLIWRIYVPNLAAPPSKSKKDAQHDMYSLWTRYGLVFETLWFLAISVGTGYLFLYKGFEWPQEPHNVQRFMW